MDAATFLPSRQSSRCSSTPRLCWRGGHLVIFDLFTARYFVQDSGCVGIPHLAVVPCILGCMFFGPFGLLTYMCVKKVHSMVGVSATAVPVLRRCPALSARSCASRGDPAAISGKSLIVDDVR